MISSNTSNSYYIQPLSLSLSCTDNPYLRLNNTQAHWMVSRQRVHISLSWVSLRSNFVTLYDLQIFCKILFQVSYYIRDTQQLVILTPCGVCSQVLHYLVIVTSENYNCSNLQFSEICLLAVCGDLVMFCIVVHWLHELV